MRISKPSPLLYVYASNTATISDYVGLEEFYTDQNYLSIATNHSLTISGDVVLDPITEIEKTYLARYFGFYRF